MQRHLTTQQWWLYNLTINLLSITIISAYLLMPTLNRLKQSSNTHQSHTKKINTQKNQACEQASQHWQQLKQQWPKLIKPERIQGESIVRELQAYGCRLVNLQREDNQNNGGKLTYQITLLASWQQFIQLFNHFEYQGNWFFSTLSIKSNNNSNLLTVDLTLEELFND